jgi:hypothetical protein
MYDRRACSILLWILIGVTISSVVMQHIQFARMIKHLNENNSIQMKEAVVMMFDEDEVLPGPYNLLDDAGMHSNAMDRPTKECTLGI